MKYKIGDTLLDENGNTGVVVIRWNDGDICYFENDTNHQNPVVFKLKCDSCDIDKTAPYDIGDQCVCGGTYKEESRWEPVCQCPRGDMCAHYDEENEICLYGKI